MQILNRTGRRSAQCECVICRKPYETADRFTAAKVHAGDQCLDCKHLPLQPPTKNSLLEVFDYDPSTGSLTYKRDFSRRHKGDDPTSETNNGYLIVTLDKTYLAHQIIWLYMTGSWCSMIDHIDHDRKNLKWDNLRDASKGENYYNKSINKNNTTGYMGVSYMKSTGKYRASININRKQIHLGLFSTAEEAYQARLAANKEHDFHINHGR